MRLIKSHASGRKLIACRGQKEVSFSPHAALHNWLSAMSRGIALAGTPAHRLLLEWVTKPIIMAVPQCCLAAISFSCAPAALVLTPSPGASLLLVPWASSVSPPCSPGSCHCLHLPLPMLSALPHLPHHPHLASAPCHKLQHAGWEPRLISLAEFVWVCPKLTLMEQENVFVWGLGFMVQVVNPWYFLQFLCSFILMT